MTFRLSNQQGRALRSLYAMVATMLVALSYASSAKAADAGWSFDPDSWDFGTLVPGTGPSPPKVFTLTNTGDVELQVIFVSVGGNEGAGFSLVGNTCGKLAPGADCEISVTFDPSSSGAKEGQLGVASQGGLAPPATTELSGTGAGPVVSITPTSESFASLPLGALSEPRALTVTNVGSLDLMISSIEVRPNQIYSYPGAEPPQFELAGGTCEVGAAMPPGGACTVDVTFAPTAPGALSADLRIGDNAPGSPHVASLEGFGIAPPWQPPPPPPFVAPRASIVHRPSKRTVKRSAVFWLRGSPTATRFACKLDDSPFRISESPVRYPRLGEGRHRFVVRALDEDGRGGPPTVFRWRIGGPTMFS